MWRVHRVGLQQRMTHPIVAQENSAEIRMPVEPDSEHVVALAFHPVGARIFRRQGGTLCHGWTKARLHEERHIVVQVVRFVDDLEPLLLPVNSREKREEPAAELDSYEMRKRHPRVHRHRNDNWRGAVHLCAVEPIGDERSRLIGGHDNSQFPKNQLPNRAPPNWELWSWALGV